ncbi:MAG: hypothetical protein HY901_11525 [Deltaproteobacteria bacterium]|nr:hypothetical protein [Deltaproteobacteria bacterium]
MARWIALLSLPAAFALAQVAGCGGSNEAGPDASASIAMDAVVPGPDAAPAEPDAAPVAPDGGEPSDAAEPPDAETLDAGPVCTSQSECGNPVQDQIANVCQGGHCRTPGPANADGSAQTVRIKLNAVYNGVFTQVPRPQVQITRLIMNKHTDGTPVTCADVKARSGDTQATRSKLDDDPQINQAFRNLTVLSFGSPQGQAFFNFFYDVPRGDGYLLYGEAWYGAREANNPTGMRATTACVENVNLLAEPPGTEVALSFQPE